MSNPISPRATPLTDEALDGPFGARLDLLDNALELAAPLNRGARGPAVAGGWAALESLLYHAGDPADRKDGRARRLAADHRPT
jgi:hypothetical protein